jgi:hypothetical protein
MPRWILKTGHHATWLTVLMMCGCTASRPKAPVKEPRVAAVQSPTVIEPSTEQARPPALEDESTPTIQLNLPTTLAMIGCDLSAIG